MIEAKAFRTFLRIYFLLKIVRLSPNIKLSLHKALIISVMTNDLRLPRLGISGACKTMFSTTLEIFQLAHWSGDI
jgi:hypothetical protein